MFLLRQDAPVGAIPSLTVVGERSETALGHEFARPLQCRQQGAPVALVAVELPLLGPLLGSVRLLPAQAEVAVEAKLQRAIVVLVQLVDDRPFTGTCGLEKVTLLSDSSVMISRRSVPAMVASRTKCVALSSTTSQ